jgi:hypothetical protein
MSSVKDDPEAEGEVELGGSGEDDDTALSPNLSWAEVVRMMILATVLLSGSGEDEDDDTTTIQSCERK